MELCFTSSQLKLSLLCESVENVGHEISFLKCTDSNHKNCVLISDAIAVVRYVKKKYY